MQKGEKMKKCILYAIFFVLLLNMVSAIEVSQPVQVTYNTHYERGESIVYDGSNYWLFYGRSDSITGNYNNANPDINDYRVYYKKANSISGLKNATPVLLSASGNSNSYLGETGSCIFNSEVWVFATIDDGANANLYGWWYSGGAWNEVPDIVTGLSTGSAHHDEIAFNNEIFVVVRRSDDFYTTHSPTPKTGGWSNEVAVGSGGGLAHFFRDGNNLYLAVLKSSSPVENQIFKYNPQTDSWSLIASTPSQGRGPTLFKVNNDYVFVQAPSDNVGGGRQYLISWTSKEINNSFFSNGAKMLSAARYEENAWTEFWPIGFTDASGRSYLFFTSERNPDNLSHEITGNIWYLEMNFNLSDNHYCTIQTALDSAVPGDVVTALPGLYREGLAIIKNGVTLQGTNKDNVIIDGKSHPYAVSVTADSVTLKNLTFSDAEAYIVKVSHCSNFNLENVLIKGQGRFITTDYGGFSGLDFNNVNNANAYNFEIKDCSKNGIAITSSSNIILNSFNVHDNGQSQGWAGLAIYTVGGTPELSGDTSFSLLGKNTFVNNPMGIYLEDMEGFKIEPTAFEKSAFIGAQQIPMGVMANGTVVKEKEFAETLGLNILVLNSFISPMRVYTNDPASVFSNPFLTRGSTIEFLNGIFPGDFIINVPVTITHGSKAIIDCNGSGSGFVVNAENTTIDGIEIRNCDNGIVVNSSKFRAIRNNLYSNKNGIKIISGAASGHISNNNISGNTAYGVLNLDAAVVNATQNWWGHYSGPYQSSTNPNASGDTVSSNVAYDPWLCTPYPSSWLTFNRKCDYDRDSYAAVNYGGNDCDDNNSEVHPNATEICNGIDDNCDGITDAENSSGCMIYYYDSDNDNYGVNNSKCLCNPTGYYSALLMNDCNDSDSAVNPGATEICNGIDDNCNGQIDEGFPDTDNDGQTDCVDNDDDNDGIPDKDDPRPLIPNVAPEISFVSPEEHSWHNKDFNVSFSDDDEDGDAFTCEYRVLAKRAAAAPQNQWEVKKNWTERDCNGYIAITVGKYKECPYEGYDYCRIESRATDVWGAVGSVKQRYFSIDITPPNIREKKPKSNEITGNPKPEIVAYWNDRGSGLNISTGQIILDGINVTKSAYILQDRIYYKASSDLSGGAHTVEVSVSDNLGIRALRTWQFTVDRDLPVVKINSPIEKAYDKRRILLDVSVNEKAKQMVLIKDDKYSLTICRNCKEYARAIYFPDGIHKIRVVAEDYAGNKDYDEKTFSVDSTPPKIYNIWPRDKSYIHGTQFGVRYTEKNLKSVKLYWRVSSGEWHEEDLECSSGRNVVCTTSLDMSEYDGLSITFYFEIQDETHTVNSRTNVVYVDHSLPDINIISPEDSQIYGAKRLKFNIELSEEADLSYSLDGSNYRTLCRDCSRYYRFRSLRDGEHNIWFKAVDKAGNTAYKSLSIAIDSKKPVIHSTKPKKRYVSSNTFIVSYTETNLKRVTLHYGNDETDGDCLPGNKMECEVNADNLADYSGQRIKYYFEIEDIFGNVVKSRPRYIYVDISPPKFTVWRPQNNSTFVKYALFDIDLSEKVRELSYTDMDTGRTRILCRNCDRYNRRLRLFPREYHVRFNAVDYAGNTNYEVREFKVAGT